MADRYAGIVSALSTLWPSRLDDWNSLDDKHRKVIEDHRRAPKGRINGQYADQVLPEPASVIALARKHNIPQLLPAAFYHLSRILTDMDWDEIYVNDGLKDSSTQILLEKGERSARWKLLTPADQGILRHVRVYMLNQRAVCNRVSYDLTPVFHNGNRCKSARSVIAGVAVQRMRTTKDILFCNRTFDTVAEMLKLGACRLCAKDIPAWFPASQRIWDDITEIVKSG